MVKIGIKLRQLRDKHGYTQDQIAEIVDMSQGNYSKLESDKYESFPGEILPILASLYGVEIKDLLQNDSSQHINLSKNKNNAINAFLVYQDSQKQSEQTITALKETIESQKEVMSMQKVQIEILQSEILNLKNLK
jgi:transcriptional regulator with XRE-family HTH domain